MTQLSIKVEHLSKRYRLGAMPGYTTFREAIVQLCRRPFNGRANRNQETEHVPADIIWALDDVSFEVEAGEVVGIIGRNGAGKSTLLKILSKVTEPTTGRCELRGNVGSLLEVGSGFHPELTGHENVYLYGAILGMDRREITRKFDEIVAFAELEAFIETPVKRYSTGMYMRLAFAVAAHLETEILLVDEVLAVGDAAFRKKCLGKMDTVAREGRTVLFVSHNLQAVRNLCTSAMLLEDGRIRNKGPVADIISTYETSLTDTIGSRWVNPAPPAADSPAHLERIELMDEDSRPRSSFRSNEDIRVRFTLQIFEENDRLKVGFDLVRNGEVAFRSQQVDSPSGMPALARGPRQLTCRIPSNLLKFGQYHLAPLMSIHMRTYLLAESIPAVKFDVTQDTGGSEFHLLLNERNQPGPLFPLLDWEVV